MQKGRMSDIELMYSFLLLHPQATNEDICNHFNWDGGKVKTYKWRLKKAGYVAIDKDEDGRDTYIFLKEADADIVRAADTQNFRQRSYRELAEAYMERINDAATTVSQMIELGRELRLILKEIA